MVALISQNIGRLLSVSVESQAPSAQNNPYAHVAYFDPLQILLSWASKRTVST